MGPDRAGSARRSTDQTKSTRLNGPRLHSPSSHQRHQSDPGLLHRGGRNRHRATLGIAATETFRELSESPLIGTPRKVRTREFQGVRMWRVRGFESYLIFYLPRDGSISVERVIHASQDYRRVLQS